VGGSVTSSTGSAGSIALFSVATSRAAVASASNVLAAFSSPVARATSN
jgi:hypothetical protein